MLCLKTFKEKTSKDFNSDKDFINFYNENKAYSKKHSRVFDFKNKCKAVDLPSFHPYWSYVVYSYKLRRVLKAHERFLLCTKNMKLIKFYFGKVGIYQIETTIQEEFKECFEYYKKIKFK